MSIALHPKHLRRYREIARLLVKYGRSDLVSQVGLEDAAQVSANGDSEAPGPAKAEELAEDLERMGPTYIKLGQLLSTRSDLIPPSYARALSRLQDDVAPFDFDEAERIVTDQLGVRLSNAFESFEREPFASASLGQVHRARLRDGRQVAVKVQRPDIRERVLEDLEALDEIAQVLDQRTEAGRRYGFAELLAQFRRSLMGELDYRREAAHLRRLGRIVRPYDRLVVPQPIDDYTTDVVLTMEYVPARKITDIGPLGRMELDGEPLASQLFKAYLDQILVEGFFHADPHPGNVLVTDDERLVLLDLGMVALVPKATRELLVKLLLAISDGNGKAAAETAVALGRPLEGFDPEGFCAEASVLVEQSQGLTLEDLDAGTMVMELMRISGAQGLRLPAELALLGKALLNLDQVSRALDPAFDPSEAIRGHIEVVVEGQMRGSAGSMLSGLLDARDFVEHLPGRINKVMDAVAEGNFELKVHAFDEAEMLRGLLKLANRVTMGLVLAALIVGAAMLVRVETSSKLFGYPSVAIVCFLAAAAGGFALVVSILRSDRRINARTRRHDP
ncbi:MAG: ubiquinone biosynthesis protein [Actinomycetota bacterium]|jgi:predicted unusual protein kinase regulating ubiquinone biosynthesis (AarF/ABC1/UbiB family)|nr:ubiquinone biosynthesis protein [Actinomycetota bacterium]